MRGYHSLANPGTDTAAAWWDQARLNWGRRHGRTMWSLHDRGLAEHDGGWTIVDLGNENGITVNGRDVPPGDSVALRPGDHIHLGAWTKITITRA